MSAPLEIFVAAKDFVTPEGTVVPVLRDIRLAMAAGERVALVGASGIGKSTLAAILLGLDRDFEGHVSPLPARTGVVFQEPLLLPWRTLAQNVALAAKAAGAPVPGAALFAELGLAGAEDRFPGALSLGMARRGALARALAIDPDFLVADEPFVSLDPPTADALRQTLAAALARRRAGLLLITHALEDALALCHRVVMLAGRPAHVVRDVGLETLGPDSPERAGKLRAALAG